MYVGTNRMVDEMNKAGFKVQIVFILIAILLEIFACNVRTFQSLFYKEKDISAYPVQLDYAHFLPNGDLKIDGESAFISIVIGNEKINDVFVDIETAKLDESGTESGVCDVTFYIQDELLYGGSVNTRVITERKILHDIKESQYVFIKSFGNAEIIQLELKPQNGNVVRIHDIKLNANRPILFSLGRLVFFLVLIELAWLFRPASFVWKIEALSPGKKGWFVILSLYFGFMLLMTMFMINNPPMWQETFNPYPKLAKAITEGHLYVGMADDEVTALADKMVSWGEADERIMFDYALYKGKYYVYFGIFPVLMLYLPYRVITGMDMTDAASLLIITSFLIPGFYMLLREIIRRFFKSTPLALHILLVVVAIFGSSLPAILSEPLVYSVAILSGVTLIIWGGFFLLKAFPFVEHTKLLLLGSSCMALAVACRPTLLLYSILMVPFSAFSYKEYHKQKKHGKELLVAVLSIVIPYAAVAGLLMVYNQIRFDSPFQFGMVYNLTAVPSKQPAVDILEMFPIAVYEYLFKTPVFEHLFPFIKGHYEGCVTEYSGTIYYYQVVGYGLFIINPILLILFIYPLKRRKHYVRLFVTVVTILLFIIFDTYMTQCMATRYTLEYSFLLFMLAGTEILELWGQLIDYRKRLLAKAILASVILSAVVNSLAIFSTPHYPLNYGNTELYYQLFYLCHFL